MSTVTKAANAHTVVTTGWTNPSNAYSTTNDSTYATIATVKNQTLNGDFGFPAFTTAEIPDHSTLSSVVFFTTYGLTATATGALVGLQARRNSTGATLGTEITRNAASMADANGTATGATLTDLRTANELRVRGRATKGNSSTASTAQIDRLYLVATFTEVVSASAGAIALTVTLGETGNKATSRAFGALAGTATLGESGKKATSGTAGASLSATLGLSGTRQEAEAHAGSGSMSLSATLGEAGIKATAGTGAAALTASEAGVGAKGTLGSGLACDLTETLAAAGRMDAVGAATLTLASGLAAAGSKEALGIETLALDAALGATGERYESDRTGTAALSVAAVLDAAGTKATDGVGSLVLVASLGAVGPESPAIAPVAGPSLRYRPMVRQVTPLRPVRRSGSAKMKLGLLMWAAGAKTSESDDELVMVLAA